MAALVVLDFLLVSAASLFAVYGRTNLSFFENARNVDALVAPLALFIAIGWVLVLAVFGSYSRAQLGAGTSEYVRVLSASATTAAALGVTAYLFNYPLSRGYFVLLFTLGTPFLILGRFAVRRLIHAARRRGQLMTPVIVAGDRTHLEDIITVLRRESWLGYRVVGVLSKDDLGSTTPSGLPVLGRPADAVASLQRTGAKAVIFTEGSFTRSVLFNRIARDLEDHDAEMIVVPALSDISAERMRIRPVAGIPLVHVERPRAQHAGRWMKRAFDAVGSTILIIVASPIMLGTAIAIKREDGGPVLFRQQRVGLRGEVFSCFKFRSMYTDAEERKKALMTHNEADGVLFKIPNDPRITKTGQFIRRFSIDEIPQFFNVWRGEMSLVGPRPALPSEVKQCKAHVRRRLDVRPGLTGLWQVSGRSDLSWEDTVRLDLYYVDNWSMLQDLSILMKTFRAVFGSRGAY